MPLPHPKIFGNISSVWHKSKPFLVFSSATGDHFAISFHLQTYKKKIKKKGKEIRTASLLSTANSSKIMVRMRLDLNIHMSEVPGLSAFHSWVSWTSRALQDTLLPLRFKELSCSFEPREKINVLDSPRGVGLTGRTKQESQLPRLLRKHRSPLKEAVSSVITDQQAAPHVSPPLLIILLLVECNFYDVGFLWRVWPHEGWVLGRDPPGRNECSWVVAHPRVSLHGWLWSVRAFLSSSVGLWCVFMRMTFFFVVCGLAVALVP